jgi:hypothetical protein
MTVIDPFHRRNFLFDSLVQFNLVDIVEYLLSRLNRFLFVLDNNLLNSPKGPVRVYPITQRVEICQFRGYN